MDSGELVLRGSSVRGRVDVSTGRDVVLRFEDTDYDTDAQESRDTFVVSANDGYSLLLHIDENSSLAGEIRAYASGGRLEIVNDGVIDLETHHELMLALSDGEIVYSGGGTVKECETRVYLNGGGKFTFTGNARTLAFDVRTDSQVQLDISGNVEDGVYFVINDATNAPRLTGSINVELEDPVGFIVWDERLTQSLTTQEALDYFNALLPDLDLCGNAMGLNIRGKDDMICYYSNEIKLDGDEVVASRPAYELLGEGLSAIAYPTEADFDNENELKAVLIEDGVTLEAPEGILYLYAGDSPAGEICRVSVSGTGANGEPFRDGLDFADGGTYGCLMWLTSTPGTYGPLTLGLTRDGETVEHTFFVNVGEDADGVGEWGLIDNPSVRPPEFLEVVRGDGEAEGMAIDGFALKAPTDGSVLSGYEGGLLYLECKIERANVPFVLQIVRASDGKVVYSRGNQESEPGWYGYPVDDTSWAEFGTEYLAQIVAGGQRGQARFTLIDEAQTGP